MSSKPWSTVSSWFETCGLNIGLQAKPAMESDDRDTAELTARLFYTWENLFMEDLLQIPATHLVTQTIPTWDDAVPVQVKDKIYTPREPKWMNVAILKMLRSMSAGLLPTVVPSSSCEIARYESRMQFYRRVLEQVEAPSRLPHPPGSRDSRHFTSSYSEPVQSAHWVKIRNRRGINQGVHMHHLEIPVLFWDTLHSMAPRRDRVVNDPTHASRIFFQGQSQSLTISRPRQIPGYQDHLNVLLTMTSWLTDPSTISASSYTRDTSQGLHGVN
jgi:hypothetical protein